MLDISDSAYNLIINVLSVVGCLFIAFLGWYRSKELQELKEIEYKIIASELNRTYLKKPEALGRRLKTLNLLPGRRAQIFNLFKKQHIRFKTYIFDSVFVVSRDESKKKVYAFGVAVDLNDIDIPKFRIQLTRPFDSFTLRSNMKKVNEDLLPNWLTQRYSVFRHRSISDASIQSIIGNNDNLYKLFASANVYMLAGNEQTVAFFQRGKLPASLPGFIQIEDRVHTLVQAFDETYIPDPDVNEEIKVLKQNEQTQQRPMND